MIFYYKFSVLKIKKTIHPYSSKVYYEALVCANLVYTKLLDRLSAVTKTKNNALREKNQQKIVIL